MWVGWGEGGRRGWEGRKASMGLDGGFCLMGFDGKELDILELGGCGRCSGCFHRKESEVHERCYLCDWIILKVTTV